MQDNLEDEFFTTEDKEDEEAVEREKEKPTDDEKNKNQGKKRKLSSSLEEDPNEKRVAKQIPKQMQENNRDTTQSTLVRPPFKIALLLGDKKPLPLRCVALGGGPYLDISITAYSIAK